MSAPTTVPPPIQLKPPRRPCQTCLESVKQCYVSIGPTQLRCIPCILASVSCSFLPNQPPSAHPEARQQTEKLELIRTETIACRADLTNLRGEIAGLRGDLATLRDAVNGMSEIVGSVLKTALRADGKDAEKDVEMA